MKIHFSDHALQQMKDRTIANALVEDALKAPDRTIPQRLPRHRALKQIRVDGKLYLLVVVYERTNSLITVVTAFRTSKLEKYQ